MNRPGFWEIGSGESHRLRWSLRWTEAALLKRGRGDLVDGTEEAVGLMSPEADTVGSDSLGHEGDRPEDVPGDRLRFPLMALGSEYILPVIQPA